MIHSPASVRPGPFLEENPWAVGTRRRRRRNKKGQFQEAWRSRSRYPLMHRRHRRSAVIVTIRIGAFPCAWRDPDSNRRHQVSKGPRNDAEAHLQAGLDIHRPSHKTSRKSRTPHPWRGQPAPAATGAVQTDGKAHPRFCGFRPPGRPALLREREIADAEIAP